MNFTKHGLPSKGVVRVREVHRLKGVRLFVEVVWIAEHDIQMDAPEGHDFLARDDPVERRYARAEPALEDLHLVKCLGVQDVEADATNHEDLDKRVVPIIGLTTSGQHLG